MTRWHAILASLLLTSIARTEEPKSAPVGLPFNGNFSDGSTVPLYVPEDKLALLTKYGKLAVPLSEIVRIDLGFRYSEGLEAKIAAAASELGATDFKEREQAEKQLLAWRELALPALRKTLKGGNPEALSRAENLLAKLQATLPKDRWEVPDYDVIVTETSTIRGTLETGSIKVTTKFFGETTLKFADLRTLRNTALDPEPKPPVPGRPIRNPRVNPFGGGPGGAMPGGLRPLGGGELPLGGPGR